MRDFRSSNSNRFNRDSRDRGDRSDRGDRRPMIMHDAVCDKCGKDCKVPFQPTGNKPVYCSDCFERQPKQSYGGRDFDRNDRGGYKSENRSYGRGDDRDQNRGNDGGVNKIQEQINNINSKLDKIIQTLELFSVVEEAPKEVKEPKKAVKKKTKSKTKPKTKTKK